ncbi:MAG: FlgD immunoglobulin-like domain containing protein [candidate division WOR-3 bacterium]|nr:FlgD immunoglobulin-like domain containing protein [candidate division WOR-3 bacterium]
MKKRFVVLGMLGVLGLGMVIRVDADCPNERVWSEVFSDTVLIHHDDAYFNCCPDMEYEIVQHADTIEIYERDLDTHPCECLCCFDLVHVLAGLEPGTYIARVWGAIGCEDRPCGVTKFTVSEKKEGFRTTNLMSNCGGWSVIESEFLLGKKGVLELYNVSSNPTRTQVQIQYNLPGTAQVVIKIYDATGTLIRTLPLGNQSTGEHSVFGMFVTTPGSSHRGVFTL